jgi:tetratricopeptide (TPR) repeat protein
MEAVNELGKAVTSTVSSGMYAEFAERLRSLAGLADRDISLLEPCGFMWFAVGMPEEGTPILERVVEHEEEVGHADRAARMREILEAMRGGWSIAGKGVFSFDEALRKRAEADAAPPAQAEKPVPAAPAPEEAPVAEEEDSYLEEGDIVRDALGRLQAKVHEEIGESDPDARYNLGIAYKEMGLLAEAVKEFRLAMSKPDLRVGATSLLADTLVELGEHDAGIAALDAVLGAETATAEERRDLRYHKGVLLSRLGREDEARSLFQALYEEAPDYRDVKSRAEGRRS